ncbi:hypothetical protein C8R44DRAFT_582345, partial [Mycena epipterygia]
ARVPTLRITDLVTKKETDLVTNEAKSAAFGTIFFPKKMVVTSVPPDAVYPPPPAFDWALLSNTLLHRVIARMKPYKGTRAGPFPNCVYLYNAQLLIPYLAPIYRSLDAIKYYPPGWNLIDTLVLRKPGNTNYADPSSFRPIVLSVGHVHLYNKAVNKQITAGAERAGILPSNHYG